MAGLSPATSTSHGQLVALDVGERVGAAVLGLATVAGHQTTTGAIAESLWAHAVECTQHNRIAHPNLAVEYAKQGRTEEAIFHLREALDDELISDEVARCTNCSWRISYSSMATSTRPWSITKKPCDFILPVKKVIRSLPWRRLPPAGSRKQSTSGVWRAVAADALAFDRPGQRLVGGGQTGWGHC